MSKYIHSPRAGSLFHIIENELSHTVASTAHEAVLLLQATVGMAYIAGEVKEYTECGCVCQRFYSGYNSITIANRVLYRTGAANGDGIRITCLLINLGLKEFS